ncbi:histidine kinase [Streptomyces sp. DSM 44917]|uniref:histidine kinase n=1 Tax=Streptomyces boetiae TaxID=3075541 RepID=A0ABU2LG77_9ACTN|nr:histidine kinase [Streptomyces sp. DSM 44917]MDT0310593.1 histidine kinase [Streptomyces sp. DSM 44917]
MSRERLADLGLLLFAAAFAVLTSDSVVPDDVPAGWLTADRAAGAAACAAVLLRRRWPVRLAVALLLSGAVLHFVTGPTLVAVYTVAARRPARTTAWVGALAAAPLPLFLLRSPDPGQETTSALTYFTLIAAAFGWGLYRRSRRMLIASLRERADRAAAEARRQARQDVAREMHDVLAHRLSLLSVHAGALEFNPGAPPEEVGRACGVIRTCAHQALEDLREIIGVLRSPESAEGPQPLLADLPRLAEESRTAGARVTLRVRTADPSSAPAPAPAATGRTAYRVVQEGLTNARKHAPGAPIAVTVGGGPGEGLRVEVRNAAAAPAASPGIPGSGRGLIGLAERATLAGGRVEHGFRDGDFTLTAWLPWPAHAAAAAPTREGPEEGREGTPPAVAGSAGGASPQR